MQVNLENLADKHATDTAEALATIAALELGGQRLKDKQAQLGGRLDEAITTASSKDAELTSLRDTLARVISDA